MITISQVTSIHSFVKPSLVALNVAASQMFAVLQRRDRRMKPAPPRENVLFLSWIVNVDSAMVVLDPPPWIEQNSLPGMGSSISIRLRLLSMAMSDFTIEISRRSSVCKMVNAAMCNVCGEKTGVRVKSRLVILAVPSWRTKRKERRDMIGDVTIAQSFSSAIS